jgi:hypothetical protein
MALLKLEVRDKCGNRLPQFCDDVLDQKLPVDHSRLARSFLQLIRGGGPSTAHSVHFLREGREIGSWSLDREGLETVVATARPRDERKPRPPPSLRLVHSTGR